MMNRIFDVTLMPAPVEFLEEGLSCWAHPIVTIVQQQPIATVGTWAEPQSPAWPRHCRYTLLAAHSRITSTHSRWQCWWWRVSWPLSPPPRAGARWGAGGGAAATSAGAGADMGPGAVVAVSKTYTSVSFFSQIIVQMFNVLEDDL